MKYLPLGNFLIKKAFEAQTPLVLLFSSSPFPPYVARKSPSLTLAYKKGQVFSWPQIVGSLNQVSLTLAELCDTR
jgi:hypothetical protein